MPSARSSVRVRRRVRATLGSVPAYTADIGKGGFSVELMRVQPPGTPVEGSLRVNGQDIAYRGEIAWAKAGEPYLALRGRIGVRFTMLPVEVNMALAALALIGVV
jgi:PilZ domain